MIKKIKNIFETEISGVRVEKAENGELLKKEHFEWTSFPLKTKFKQNQVISGVLKGWHRVIAFTQVEYHDDAENFLFFQGDSIMIFCDKKNNKVDMNSVQLVRIPEGTQIEVAAGKCHYVPIPLTDTFKAFVFTPLQEAFILPLQEEVLSE